MRWLHRRLTANDRVEVARRSAREPAESALAEGRAVPGHRAGTEDGRFLPGLTRHAVDRTR
ncbi:hypothetical protein [Micromonospora wenchangensis]|uniref:hypothetical protein n=1 Tax=Micromonospora wenchangensis TaxID=1185415 RepID=UPI003D761910